MLPSCFPSGGAWLICWCQCRVSTRTTSSASSFGGNFSYLLSPWACIPRLAAFVWRASASGSQIGLYIDNRHVFSCLSSGTGHSSVSVDLPVGSDLHWHCLRVINLESQFLRSLDCFLSMTVLGLFRLLSSEEGPVSPLRWLEASW